MPICKNCGSRISKFDKDMCPVCGTKNPLEGISSDTIDITSSIGKQSLDEMKIKKRKTFFLLIFTCGFLAIPFFYLKKNKFGLCWLTTNMAFFAICFVLFFLVAHLPIWASLLIGLGFLYFTNLSFGLFLLTKKDLLKDGLGNFLR